MREAFAELLVFICLLRPVPCLNLLNSGVKLRVAIYTNKDLRNAKDEIMHVQ